MFYKLNTARISLGEYVANVKSPAEAVALPIVFLLKLLRVKIPAVAEEPPVDSLLPFRARDEDLSAAERDALVPLENELGELGFFSPVYFVVESPLQKARYCVALLRHDDGQAAAKIVLRTWKAENAPKKQQFRTSTWFATQLSNGETVATTNDKPDLKPPKIHHVVRRKGMPIGELWALHGNRMAEFASQAAVRNVRSQAELIAAEEAWQQATVKFQAQRRVYAPLNAADEAKASVRTAELAQERDDPYVPVLTAMDKAEEGKLGSIGSLLLLVVSVAAFILLGGAAWSWEFVALLVPILFFHELGHFVAMKLFGYRNVRMFFIPLLGAAVTGKNHRVPGWKKALVSLAGPVPGIAVGIVLGGLGMWFGSELAVTAALVALALNALNLLPVLPLDGGWVAHAVLFSRNFWFDAGFRIATALALFAAAALLQERAFTFLAIATAVSIPWSLRVAKIVGKLRREGLDQFPVDAADEDRPAELTRRVIDEVTAASPMRLKPKVTGQFTERVLSGLYERPPGVAASLALAGLQGGSFIAAVVFAGVLFIHKNGGFFNFMMAAANQAATPVAAGDVQTLGDPAATVGKDVVLVAANADDGLAAAALAMGESNQPGAAVTRFGNSVIVVVPEEDAAARTAALDRLEAQCKNVFVIDGDLPAMLSFSGIAADDASAERLKQALEGYLRGGLGEKLVPPWDPAAALTPAQVAARTTYARAVGGFEGLAAALEPDPEFDALSKQIAAEQRRGNRARVEELQDEVRAAVERREERRLAEIRATGDSAIVDLYNERPKFEDFFDLDESEEDEAPDEVADDPAAEASARDRSRKWDEANDAWQRKLAQKLGALPVGADGKPTAESACFAASRGWVVSSGPLVTVSGLVFTRPDLAAPQVLRWLEAEGLADVKYALDSQGFFAEEFEE